MKSVRTCLGALALVAVAGGAFGETAEIARAPILTLEQAKAVAAAAAAEARGNGAGGAIAVVDAGGHLLYLERLDGTFPAAAPVATHKAQTAAIFRRATADFETAIRNGRTSLVAVPEMTPLQGGVPIRVGGTVVGAVGVSGAASAEQDEAIAKVAAQAVRWGPPGGGDTACRSPSASRPSWPEPWPPWPCGPTPRT